MAGQSAYPVLRPSAPAQILGLGADEMRQKASQEGYVYKTSAGWHIQFFAWMRTKDGTMDWKRQSRKVCGLKDEDGDPIGEKKAWRLGYERFVIPANAVNARPQGLMTVAQFVAERFTPDHVKNLKTSGQIHYKYLLDRHVLPNLGSMQLNAVTPLHVQTFINIKRDDGLSPQTLYHIRNAVSAVFTYAHEVEYLDKPLRIAGVRMPPKTNATRSALTMNEVRMIAAGLPALYGKLVIFLARTGLRIGEASALCWKHINLTGEVQMRGGESIPPYTIAVRENWVRHKRTTPKTKSSVRNISMDSAVWVMLQEMSEVTTFGGPDQSVFPNRDGEPIDEHNIARRFLKPAARAAACPEASWHWFRHTAATLMDRAMMTDAEKLAVLGHSKTTQARYIHPDQDTVREKLERVQ